MIINDFEMLICSPSDKEKLTCEILYKDEDLAEISQETNEFILTIYAPLNNQAWSFSLNEFQEVLEAAKNHLTGKK